MVKYTNKLAPATKLSAEERLIGRALRLIESQILTGEPMDSPNKVRSYLCLRLGMEKQEHFGAVWLDTQHRVIGAEEMFHGTLGQAPAYPREVLKRALSLDAAAVILYHNHPSGIAEPSAADSRLTSVLKGALELIDVRVLDHIIVGGAGSFSFAERGLL